MILVVYLPEIRLKAIWNDHFFRYHITTFLPNYIRIKLMEQTIIEDLPQIIDDARKAQQTWSEVPVKTRAKRISAIRDYLVQSADETARLIHEVTGKSRIDALSTEVISTANAVRYYSRQAPKFLRPRSISAGHIVFSFKRSKVYRHPFGVIGIISPWNYPFTIPFHEVVIALLSGNAVMLKPASRTQKVGVMIEECIQAADLPSGLFRLVKMPGNVAGDALMNSGIDKLFFTGSVAVGKLLMAKASQSLTPVSLELGGNDAMIVCEDADLERAANGALWGSLQNSGQSCGGIERIYVHDSVYDTFLDLLRRKLHHLSVGDNEANDYELGPMISQEQAEKTRAHLTQALESGAQVYAQSPALETNIQDAFVPAMVLTNVTHEMQIMQEETFGPVLGVMKYAQIEEAIRMANDSHMGLTGSVWSKNQKRAEAIGRRIEAGAVMINDHLMSHGLPETPWGGFKQSGIGRTHGKFGFDEMTQPQVIIRDTLPFVKKNYWWYPYDEHLYQSLKALLELLHSKSIWQRIGKFFKVLRAVPRIFQSWDE